MRQKENVMNNCQDRDRYNYRRIKKDKQGGNSQDRSKNNCYKKRRNKNYRKETRR